MRKRINTVLGVASSVNELALAMYAASEVLVRLEDKGQSLRNCAAEIRKQRTLVCLENRRLHLAAPLPLENRPMNDPEISVTLFRRKDQDVWQMQYVHPETGRKVQRTTKKTSRRDAERVAGKWEEDLKSGRDNRLGRMPWADFRERYENEVVSGHALKTAGKVSSIFTKLEELIHPAKIGSLNADALQRFQKALRDQHLSESTIKGYLAHLRAALAWAVDVGLLAAVPKFPKTQRAKQTRVMKGRPITGEEFERMLSKVDTALVDVCEPGKERSYTRWKPEARAAYLERRREQATKVAPSWKSLIRGLWLSGLRIGEALELHWTDESRLRVDLSSRYPMLRIPAEREKGHKDRLLPIAPEFAEFLLAIPEGKRHGFVFNPQPLRADKQGRRLGQQQVERIITTVGKLAAVKVAERPKGETLAVKFASAHDLRRSFGDRWASRVMPQVLMELMRHESIETTLRYYVGRNAQQTASVLYEAARLASGGVSGGTGQSPQETTKPHSDVSHCGA
jgi:integrase